MRDLHTLLLETEVREGKMVCGNCRHEYRIKEGIANFLLPSHLGELLAVLLQFIARPARMCLCKISWLICCSLSENASRQVFKVHVLERSAHATLNQVS